MLIAVLFISGAANAQMQRVSLFGTCSIEMQSGMSVRNLGQYDKMYYNSDETLAIRILREESKSFQNLTSYVSTVHNLTKSANNSVSYSKRGNITINNLFAILYYYSGNGTNGSVAYIDAGKYYYQVLVVHTPIHTNLADKIIYSFKTN